MEKDNFRHLNIFYKKIDLILAAFDQEFRSDIDSYETRQNTIDSIYESAAVKLRDIRESLELNLELTGELLSGSPKPIFVEKKYNKTRAFGSAKEKVKGHMIEPYRKGND